MPDSSSPLLLGSGTEVDVPVPGMAFSDCVTSIGLLIAARKYNASLHTEFIRHQSIQRASFKDSVLQSKTSGVKLQT